MRVLDVLMQLFCRNYGCEPEDVEMAATLDDLNIAPHEREDMAVFLGELYGVIRKLYRFRYFRYE